MATLQYQDTKDRFARGCIGLSVRTGSAEFRKIEIKELPVPPKPDNRQPAELQDGVLVLQTKIPIIRGVEAWVEVDGKRVTDWKVGTREVRVRIPAGKHRVAVYSIYQRMHRTIFKEEIEVVPDTTKPVDVGP